MGRPVRIDSSRFDKAELTPQGYLRAPAVVTRVGVLKYQRPDGTIIRELRHPDEVFSQKSLDSLKSIPITNEHPKELLNPKNTSGLMVGFTSDQTDINDDKFLQTFATFTDADAIRAINNGKVELSCGYTADLDHTPGEYEGEPYDCVQRNITYNHVSLVKKGRAGPDVRLMLDSADAMLVDEDDNQPTKGEDMANIKIDGKEFEVSDELAKAFNDMMDEMEEDKKEMMDAMEKSKAPKKGGKEGDEPDADDKKKQDKKKMDSLTEENEKLQARVDSLTEELKVRKDSENDQSKMQEMVKARIRLEGIATRVLGKDTKLDSMNDLELMSAVVTKKSESVKLDGKSEIYIQARFDHIAEGLEASDSFVEEKMKETSKKRHDGAESGSAAEARQRMIEANKSAWKN